MDLDKFILAHEDRNNVELSRAVSPLSKDDNNVESSAETNALQHPLA